MRKIIKIILVIIIGLIVMMGFLVGLDWWQNREEASEAPKLFSREDYQIEETNGDKFIVVDKIGLRAKVPAGWIIEIVGDDFPEPEYWVNLSSPDAVFETILKEGCGISILVSKDSASVNETVSNIKILEENPELSNQIKTDYTLSIIKIKNYKSLKWVSLYNDIMGQVIGIMVPYNNEVVVGYETRIQTNYEDICSPIWEEFIANIELE